MTDQQSYREVFGVEWCDLHAGVINEGEEVCDMAHADTGTSEEGEPRPCINKPLYLVCTEEEAHISLAMRVAAKVAAEMSAYSAYEAECEDEECEPLPYTMWVHDRPAGPLG